jgi:hypothetical protein
MTIVNVNVTVSESRAATMQVPAEIPPGDHWVTLVFDPNSDNTTTELEFQNAAFDRKMMFLALQRTRHVQLGDDVALLEDLAATDFTTGEPILLRRGQMGQVVSTHGPRESQVDFTTRNGHRYGLLSIPNDMLMVLLDSPEQPEE